MIGIIIYTFSNLPDAGGGSEIDTEHRIGEIVLEVILFHERILGGFFRTFLHHLHKAALDHERYAMRFVRARTRPWIPQPSIIFEIIFVVHLFLSKLNVVQVACIFCGCIAREKGLSLQIHRMCFDPVSMYEFIKYIEKNTLLILTLDFAATLLTHQDILIR